MCVAPAIKPVDRKSRNQGMNWASQHKRLAIYTRDGFACCYCGSSVEEGVKLTLDHIIPHSLGGGNEVSNLITCCHKCNSSRGNRPVADFVRVTAAYVNHGIQPEQILAHIQDCVARPIDTKTAKELIARRGSCFNVLQSMI